MGGVGVGGQVLEMHGVAAVQGEIPLATLFDDSCDSVGVVSEHCLDDEE